MLQFLKKHPLAAAGFFITAFLLMLLAYPGEGTRASVRGVVIWWDVLFPSLLPFLVITELMLGFGVVHFFGSLLDPLMRPLFRVPGIGGFVMAMGFASGYPMAARLTSQLWEEKLVSREEGERLVAFSTTSDPIFLIGAVSVGFFHDAGMAIVLGIAHYGTAIVLGLLMRFHGKESPPSPAAEAGKGSLLRRSFEAMHMARLRDGRPFGLMLRQAIQSAIQLIFVIGGLVVFASTVLEMLSVSNILALCHTIASAVLHWTGFPAELSQAVVNGLFEVTLGAKSAGSAGVTVPLEYKAAAAAFILAWSGLSVHAQIVSLLHRTNLRYTPFLAARLVHGFLSAAAVLLFWDALTPLRTQAAEAFLSMTQASRMQPGGMIRNWSVPGAGLSFILLAAALMCLTALLSFCMKIRRRHKI